jgi:Transcriptional regulator, AbiEi antitoxin, Type IV TA system
MEITEQAYLQRARSVLNEILDSVPKLKVEWHDTNGYNYPPEVARLVDFTLGIFHDSYRHSVIGEFRAHGFPQQLTQAIDHMLRYRHKTGRNGDQLMVAAPYITPEGAKLCRDDQVSYFDLAGNCRIAMGLLYIERTGIPNPFQKNVMAAPSLYGMRGERILRTLLTDPKQAWKVVPLANRTGVSAGTVSIVRKLLIERDWAKDTPDGILLTQPEKLLRDWAQVWGRRAVRPFGYFGRGTAQELEMKIGAFAQTQDRSIALTGAAAAWRYAPMTRYQRTQVYWNGEPQELADLMDWKNTDSGANVQILTPRDRGVFDGTETIDGVPVVCPVQAFLDLQRDPARGQEAAEHLWQTRLFRV